MSRWVSLSFAGMSCVLVASTLMAATPLGQDQPQPGAPMTLVAPEDPGAILVVRMCNRCHDSARIIDRRRTMNDWQDLLLKMIEKGAEGDEKEFETVFAYLCLNYGQLRINDAPADEIVMTTGLSRPEADAIVTYRTANGPFKDFDALTKVPNVDAKALEKRKDALTF